MVGRNICVKKSIILGLNKAYKKEKTHRDICFIMRSINGNSLKETKNLEINFQTPISKSIDS